MKPNSRKSVFDIDFFENLTGDIAAPSAKDIEDIGTRIRAIREEKGASLEDLSRLTGFEVAFLSGIESNQVQPQLGTMIKLSKALDSAFGGDGSRVLASLAVAEGWQGRGLARAIIEHLQRHAGPPLWLTCREGLVPLYTRFGFREVTEARELSPYFRRLMRLARVILRIVRPEEGLAVMLWPESCTNREDRPVSR